MIKTHKVKFGFWSFLFFFYSLFLAADEQTTKILNLTLKTQHPANKDAQTLDSSVIV